MDTSRMRVPFPELNQSRIGELEYLNNYMKELKHYMHCLKINENRRIKKELIEGEGYPRDPAKIEARKYLSEAGSNGEVYRAIKYLIKMGIEIDRGTTEEEILDMANRFASSTIAKPTPLSTSDKITKIKSDLQTMKETRKAKSLKQLQRELNADSDDE